MIAKRPTSDQLDALRAACMTRRPKFLSDFAIVARSAKVTPAAAKRAWLHGWPGIAPLATEFSSERDAMVATLKAERVASAALARAHVLGEKLQKLEPTVERLVERLGEELDVAAMTPMQVADTLRSVVAAHRGVAAMTASAIELSRLLEGEATSIVQHTSSSAAPVDLEAAKTEALALLRAVEREQAKKRLATTENADDDIVH